MYIRSPALATNWQMYANPFSPPAWAATALFFVPAVALAVWATFGSAAGSPAVVAVGMLCQQGIEPQPPGRLSSRLALLTGSVAGLVIFASYAGSLTSFLAVFKLRMPFDSFRDMYHKTDYRIGSLTGSAYDDVFKVFFALLMP